MVPLVLGLALCQSAVAVEPRVAGLTDLVIYDPGTHEQGLPDVTFEPDGEGQEVDIAPIVHVHRNYYNGNQEYQGPIISGGPTVVVANHPRTGERMYLDVMLPAGAPIIEYDNSKITYVFADRRVVICFSGRNKATIKHLSGRGAARIARERAATAKEKHKVAVQQSTLAGALKEAACDAKKMAVGAVGVVGQTATAVVQTGQKIVSVIPGVQALQSAADQRKERLEMEGLRQAGKAQAFLESETIRTVR